MLECVVNISEGRDHALLSGLARAAGSSLLDVHTDPHHHRSVFTLAGPDVESDVRELARETVLTVDITDHEGVHPRIGALDVVPFVALPGTSSTFDDAVRARNRFGLWLASELGVPCFLYGPERSLPEVRKGAFVSLKPDGGPTSAHPTAGATAVGARDVLIAYNLWLGKDFAVARRVATDIRSATVRSLCLDVGGMAQVSCNLIDPQLTGPGDVYDAVAAMAEIDHAELVGLLPKAFLDREPTTRWDELGLSNEVTIEARLTTAGLNRGKV